MISVLDSMWFSQMMNSKSIGIVKIKNEVGDIKYYIGNADGLDECSDAIHIAETGAKFPVNAAIELFGEEE